MLYRVNAAPGGTGAGATTVVATDGGPDWIGDHLLTGAGQNGALLSGQVNNTFSNGLTNAEDEIDLDNLSTVVPWELFVHERGDNSPTGPTLDYSFEVEAGNTYEVTVYYTENFQNIFTKDSRVFDVEVEGAVPDVLNDISPLREAVDFVDGSGAPIPTFADGNDPNKGPYLGVAFSRTYTITATDDSLNLSFLHNDPVSENPKVNAIEIAQIGAVSTPLPTLSIVSGPIQSVGESDGSALVSITTSETVPIGEQVTFTYVIEGVSATPKIDYSPDESLNGAGTATFTGTGTIVGGSSDFQIPIDILPDEDVEGPETFTVTITSISPNAQIGAVAQTTVTIQDDDVVTNPGEVVVAINAGGPALTQDGINFVADQFFSIPSNTFTDGVSFDINNGNGAQSVFDGTVFETERFGSSFNYSIPVAAGNYTIDLYLAEIFQSTEGARIFDVTVEGQLVLDDFDILAQTGGDFNQSIVFTLPGIVSPDTFGETNAIDIAVNSSVDFAKVSGIVIRTADDTADDTFNGSVFGDFSDDNANPDDVTLSLGSNTLVSTGEFSDADYITFEVQVGQQLVAINLADYVGGSNAAFLGIQVGDTIPTQTDIQNAIATLDGGTVYNSDQIGSDILPLLASNTVEGAGQPTNGLTLPLGPGLYTLWFNQNQELTESTLELITEDLPAALSVTLDPISISEGGGTVSGMVTRNTDTSTALEITLSSDDTTEATVPATVTIPIGATSASFVVTVEDDMELDGIQTPNITAAATGFENGTASLEVIDDDAVDTTMFIEAEDITNVTGYRLEGNSAASGGQMLSLLGFGGPETGTATFIFTGPTGTYDINLGTFDESDGEASLTVQQNGVQIGETIVLDQNATGGTGANNSTKVTRLVGSSIELVNGATIIIAGFEDASEHARFDFIEFTTAGSTTPMPPTASDDDFTTDEANSISDSVLANDTGTPLLTVLEVNGSDANVGNPVTLSSGALLTVNSDGTFDYDPNGAFDDLATGEVGTETFTYLVGNSQGVSEATATITINGADGVAIAITGGTAIEAGDDGTTTDAEFTLTSSDLAFSGDLDINLLINGDLSTETVTFTAGEATFTVLVDNDDVDNGTDPVAVELDAVPAGFEIDPLAASATFEVTEDDFIAGTPLALDGDLDNDGQINSIDNDIDGDGTLNLDDRTAYDDGTNGVPTFSKTEPIVLDFSSLADGATPFQGGFTGLAQTSNDSLELNYATNAPENGTNPASVVNGKLEITSTNDDTLNADSGFTFLADNEGQSFVFEGLLDNPVFNGIPLPSFSQYGLILSLTGAPGVSGADFVKLTAGNPGAALELSGSSKYGSVPKPGYPASFDSTSYAQVELTLKGTVENGLISLAGNAKYLDENGTTLFELTTAPLSIASTTPLYKSLTGDSGAPEVAFGLTSTDTGSGGSFTFGVESLSLTKPEVVVDPPTGSNFGQELLESLDAGDGIATGGSYAPSATGSAELSVMANVNNVQSSNFGLNSFQLTNTGDKKIAAFFIDFRDAVFGDSIVDFDGSGGDTAFKKFAVDGGGAETGAFFDGNDGKVYYLPGEPPLPNNTGTGKSSSGGFRGLLLKASNNSGDGFETGETVGFSGDMDPNSIAGLLKGNNNTGGVGVDIGATGGWDVGGISGAEIAGSRFFVRFDDGTIASGVLANNGTQAGSVGQAVQEQPEVPVNVTVNGGSGVYGNNGAEPTIVVTGPIGQSVKIVLAKGLQPVTNDTNGYGQLVEDRLELSQPEFQVNNGFDFQEVIVTIGSNGTITLPSGAFDYSDTESGVQFSGDDVAPIAISAVAVDINNLPIGPVDREYLTNPTQTPVVTVEPESSGFFKASSSGNNLYFKIQIEDAAALNGGTSPNGKWNYVTAPDDEGRQTGFQGTGYYIYGSNTSNGFNQVVENEILEFEIEVPEALVGQAMKFRARASRDGLAANDQQNDLWINVVSKNGTGSIEEFLVGNGANEAEPASGEFIKVFGGPNNGNWGYAGMVDGAPNNFQAQIAFPEAGRYVLEVAGRSQGFHVDFIELFTGFIGPGVSNSVFVSTGSQPVQLVSEIPDQVFTDGTADIFDLPTDTFFDPDGDLITYQVSATAANGSDVSGVTIDEVTGQISGLSTLDIDVYNLTVTALDPDGAAADTFEIDIVDELTLEALTIPVDAVSDDFEQFGGSFSSDLEFGLNGNKLQRVGLRFDDITIPAGAAITNAYIAFTAIESNAAPASFTIGIQGSENAPTFSSSGDLTGRDAVAQVNWTNVEAWTDGQTYQSPNIAGLIQQVIGADGTTNGALAFFVEGSGSRAAESFGGSRTPPALVIEFGSTGPSVPAVNLSVTPNQASETENTTITVTATATSAVAGSQTLDLALSGAGIDSGDFEGILPTQITIADGQTEGSVTLTVADDSDIEGTETATFAISNPSSGVALGSVTSDAVAILDNDSGTTQPTETITLEAESADTIVNYRFEQIGVASGGMVLSFVGGTSQESGSASFTFGDTPDELTGTYDITIGTFNESDGAASFGIQMTDFETGVTTNLGSLVLDAPSASNLANAQTKVNLPIAFGVGLTSGDIITVNGFENAAEHARFDFLSLDPVIV